MMLFMEPISNVDTREIGLKNGVYLPVARCFSAGDMCSALVLGDYQINHPREYEVRLILTLEESTGVDVSCKT